MMRVAVGVVGAVGEDGLSLPPLHPPVRTTPDITNATNTPYRRVPHLRIAGHPPSKRERAWYHQNEMEYTRHVAWRPMGVAGEGAAEPSGCGLLRRLWRCLARFSCETGFPVTSPTRQN